jgi:hypothetical protein
MSSIYMSLSRLQMEMIVLTQIGSLLPEINFPRVHDSPVVRGCVAEGCARRQFKAGDSASSFIESRDD